MLGWRLGGSARARREGGRRRLAVMRSCALHALTSCCVHPVHYIAITKASAAEGGALRRGAAWLERVWADAGCNYLLRPRALL